MGSLLCRVLEHPDSAHDGFVLTSKSEGKKRRRKNLNKGFPKKLLVKKK